MGSENLTAFDERLNVVDAADEAAFIKRLEKPKGSIDVVIDTDAFNEIDDQFALAYLIKKEEKLKLKAIYAAPFHNDKSSGAGDGMEKSYNEIFKVLSLMKRGDLSSIVYRGSESFLPSETEPVVSDAARHLAEIASTYTTEKPLYVIGVAAITNVASALLIKPEIKDRIVVIWLGGNAFDWHHNIEFNIRQDVAAARILFGCGVPVVQLPCMGVVSAFTTSGPELEYWLRGKNELCDYLVDVTTKEALEHSSHSTWSRAIWDVTAVAWLLDADFMSDRLEPSPIPEYDHYYAFNKTRHRIRYVFHINRDALFEDLFETLASKAVCGWS